MARLKKYKGRRVSRVRRSPRKAAPASRPLGSQLSSRNRYNVGFPQSLKRSLRYIESDVTLNPGVGGTAASYVFSANGLYDPNITGGGHQPMGFDQYMSVYNHYNVIACKMTATFSSLDSTNSQIVGVHVTADGASITYGQEAIENGRCIWRTIGPKGSNRDTVTLTYPISLKRFFGTSVMDNNFRGTSATLPAEQAYPTVFCFPNTGSDTDGVQCTVVLEYVSVFTEPRELNQS